ncbi:MAG: VCBS repeat-containing protein, partial [Spirochaetia bacterium]|nr:VCBS repeat-containing protein [Spirochaetia bacterium]
MTHQQTTLQKIFARPLAVLMSWSLLWTLVYSTVPRSADGLGGNERKNGRVILSQSAGKVIYRGEDGQNHIVLNDGAVPEQVLIKDANQDGSRIRIKFQKLEDPAVKEYIVTRTPGFVSSLADKDGAIHLVAEEAGEWNDFITRDMKAGDTLTYTIRAVHYFGQMSVAAKVEVTLGESQLEIKDGEEKEILFDKIRLRTRKGSLSGMGRVNFRVGFSGKKLMEDEGIQFVTPVYRLGPSGSRFQEALLTELEYDARVIPGGYSRDEIKIFLKSEGDTWRVLPTVAHDKGRNRISANVPHFSEIAAGFLSAPTESQTRFNVNTKLPEFKLPDPLGGRTMIEAPQPSLSGALGQSIPVPLPPGREGLTPSLSLSYNSGSGNGLLGIGWSLAQEGITRDTRRGIPTYTTNDIFFYNGQELIYSNGSTSPRIYKLKNESSFIRLEYYPSNVGADGYWKVLKDGVTKTYGSVSLNRGEVQGRSITGLSGTFSWQLRETAKFGHSIFYNYTNQSGKNELSEINYQDNLLRVVFDYSNRKDVLYGSSSGLSSVQSNLLIDFQIQEKLSTGSWSPVRTYVLNYSNNQAGDALLKRVDLLHQNNTKTLETFDFNYASFSYLLSSETNVNDTTNAIPYDLFRRQMMDVNGDGMVDILVNLEGLTNTNFITWKSYTNDGAMFRNGPLWSVIGASNMLSERVQFQDVNADGKPDVIADYTGLEGTGTFYRIYTNKGSGWVYATNWTNAGDSSRFGFSDMNGDGRADIVYNEYGVEGTAGTNKPSWKVYTNAVTGYAYTPLSFTSPEVVEDFRSHFMDMNGDHKPDLVINNDGRGTNCYTVYHNLGTNFYGVPKTNRSPDVESFRKSFKDMNQDGRPDMVVSSNGLANGDGTWVVYYNLNDDFDLAHPIAMSGPTNDLSRVSFSDLNSDGRPDILVDMNGILSDGEAEMWINNRTNFQKFSTNINLSFSELWRVSRSDVNGDGRQDYFIQNDGRSGKTNGSYGLIKRLANNYNLLCSITANKRVMKYEYTRVNAGLGFPQNVLSAYTVANSFTNGDADSFSNRITYDYGKGKYDIKNKIFYGFGNVSTYDAASNRQTVVFDQSAEEMVGKQILGRKEVKKASGSYQIISESTNYYRTVTVNGGKSKLVLLTNALSRSYDLGFTTNSSQLTTRVSYLYNGLDFTGSAEENRYYLLSRKVSYGLVSNNGLGDLKAGDNLIEDYDYTAEYTNINRLPVPVSMVKTNTSGDVLSKEFYAYDGLSEGSLGANGLLSQKRVWNGVNGGGDKFLTNSYLYEASSARVTNSADPKGITHSYVYDSTKRFIASITTSLGDNSAQSNEIVWGVKLKEISLNNRTNTCLYDEYLRITNICGPLDDSAHPLMSYFYGESGNVYYTQLKHRKFHNDTGLAGGEGTYIEVLGFADGLGREMQTRVWKDSGNYVMSGKTVYDGLGRVTQKHDPVEQGTGVALFTNYTPSSSTTYKTTFAYDELSRTTNQTRGSIVAISYFDNLLTNRSKDPMGNVKQAVKDEFGRTTKVVDYVGGSPSAQISYAYDGRSNLISTTDISNNVISLKYDELGRKTNMLDPDMGNWSYKYSDYGELTNQIDASGQIVAFYYDVKGQLTNKDYPNTSTAEVSYFFGTNIASNQNGRLIRVEDESGSESYLYDAGGSVTNIRKVIDGSTYDTGYSYDALGRIRDLIYPHTSLMSTFTVRYTYQDQSGLLNRIARIDGAGSEVEVYMNSLAYDSFGRRTTMTYGNDIATTYTYNGTTSLLDQATVAKVAGSTFQNNLYKFDNNGCLTNLNETVTSRVHTYTYDALSRLTRDAFVTNSATAYDHQFSYDANGNIVHKEVDSTSSPTKGNRSYKYGSAHVHAVTNYTGEYNQDGVYDANASFGFVYDLNGNLTNKTVSSGSFSTRQVAYTWDAENRLKSMKTNGATSSPTVAAYSYVYDHSGERIKQTKSAPGTSTYTIAGLSQVKAGNLQYFIFDGVNRIASVTHVDTTKKTFFMHTDQIGSTTLVTTSSGTEFSPADRSQPYQRLSSFAFGTQFSQWRSSGAGVGAWYASMDSTYLDDIGNYTFTGQEQDESGLLYYGARYYDSKMGRFISGDTKVDGVEDTQGYGRYTYVKNNPVRFLDPSGHNFFEDLLSGALRLLQGVVEILTGVVQLVGAIVFTVFAVVATIVAGPNSK